MVGVVLWFLCPLSLKQNKIGVCQPEEKGIVVLQEGPADSPGLYHTYSGTSARGRQCKSFHVSLHFILYVNYYFIESSTYR